jgi:hypothetical protein
LGKRGDDHRPPNDRVASWNTFSPIISDPVTSGGESGKSERFVLLPNRRFITVLAYKTGKRIGALLPCLTKEEPVEITTVVHATLDSSVQDLLSSSGRPEQVLLVGCKDGTIRIFHLSDLQKPSGTMQDCGPYLIPGACYRPRGVIQVTKEASCCVKQMAVAFSDQGRIVVYALMGSTSKEDSDGGDLSLFRVSLPSKQRTVSFEDLEKESLIYCVDRNVKNHAEKDNNPFCLVVSSQVVEGGDSQTPRFTDIVLVPSPGSILVYLEKHGATDRQSFPPVTIHSSSRENDTLTAITVSSNQKDLACGHSSGTIRILTDLLPRVKAYYEERSRYEAQSKPELGSKKPKDPSKGMVIRNLHWHAHPVVTMVFAGAGDAAMLYSGADESVVVTWQLSRGSNKPAEVLPRVALGGIVHMSCTHQAGESDALLVYCSDNSLHLFETHNQCLKWKTQGVAAGMCQTVLPSIPRIMIDPLDSNCDSPNLILTGLSQAPGIIQIYDTRQQQAVSSLEVVPYNRVSRTEAGDSPMPQPTVSHSSWSESGEVALTIDIVPTENHAVGACERLEDGSAVGSTTTIRFWSCKQGSYELVAAMASPHGSGNRVSAAVLSSNGKYACTVSNDEKAFRLWRCVVSDSLDDGNRSAEWLCRYKVDVPAGYSNHETGTSAVAFSADASLLAIAFGSIITLWDHHNVTLLTSLRHLGDDATIDSVQFVQSSKLVDMVLVSSASGVSLQSPFGKQGPPGTGWVWAIPSSLDDLRVSGTAFVPQSDIVSISLYDATNNKSRILLVDAISGGLSCLQGLDATVDVLDDEVVCVTGVAQTSKSSGWGAEDVQRDEQHTFYALTRNGEVIAISNERTEAVVDEVRAPGDSEIPRLPQHLHSMSSRKRPVIVLTMTDLEEKPKKKLSLNNFGGFVGDDAASSLPQLNGAFARAFVGRHLRRQDQ